MLLGGAVVNFTCFSYLEKLQIHTPEWTSDLFVLAPIVFIVVVGFLWKFPPILRLLIAGTLGGCIVLAPYLLLLHYTTSSTLTRSMNPSEVALLNSIAQGRFILWSPSSPHSTILLPADSDGTNAKEFLKSQKLIDSKISEN